MKAMKQLIEQSLTNAKRTLDSFLADPATVSTIAEIAECISESFLSKGKVIIFGNGGSMCDAMHFAEELTGRFRKDRPALPAIAISDPSHITCVANDFGFDEIFARSVSAYAAPQDIVIGISTSGNSPNVIRGIESAQEIGCKTFALLGQSGGKLKGACDFEIIVPGETSDRIQEIHMIILHILVQSIEHNLFYKEDISPAIA
jgi:D-sedoheptulose 7-phosphate isomerase